MANIYGEHIYKRKNKQKTARNKKQPERVTVTGKNFDRLTPTATNHKSLWKISYAAFDKQDPRVKEQLLFEL